MELPEPKYALNGDIHLAYLVIGDGPVDIVVVPDWVTFIEASGTIDGVNELWERLGALGRLVLTDARGMGSSDPVALGGPATFEHAAEDLRVIMDAIGSERAFLIGHTTSAMLACLFAATYPERTAGLILAGGQASALDRGDGIGFPLELRDSLVEFVVSSWGDPDSQRIRLAAPGEGREALHRQAARMERMALSPSAARQYIEMMFDMDVRAALPSIQAPTLVIHRTGDRIVPVAAGRYLAEHIAGARYVEYPGDDHFWFLGEGVDSIVEDIVEFITGTRPVVEPDRVLVTLLFTDIVKSTEQASQLGDHRWRELLDRHDAAVRRQLTRFSGREVKTTGDGFLATFDGPARAIRCACAIRDAVRTLGVDVRAGLHTGEVERRGEDIGGIAVHVAQRVSGLAGSGQVFVSRTVVDLVAGSGIKFSDRDEHELKGVPGSWRLFEVEG